MHIRKSHRPPMEFSGMPVTTLAVFPETPFRSTYTEVVGTAKFSGTGTKF